MPQLIHIVDDDLSVRGATSFLLSSHGYATRIYASGREFLGQGPMADGCVLLDLRMSDMSGIEVLERLNESGSSIPVIMLTGHGDVLVAVQSLQLGAVDFIEKPYEERDLLAAIERALAGGGRDRKRDEARKAAVGRLQPLSEREMQVLRGLVAGMTNKEMARRLGLSPRTVEMHRSTMMADLGVDSSADAIRIALDAELTPLEEESRGHAPTAAALAPMSSRRGRGPLSSAPKHLGEILPPVLDVLEGSTDSVLLLNRQFDVTYRNANAAAAVGGGRDLVGENFWSLFPGLRQTGAFVALTRAADERTAISLEFFAPGSGRWYNLRVRPIPSGLLVFFRDFTLERSADAALSQSEEPLRLALDASGDGTWDWDVRSGRLILSRHYAERLDDAEMPLDTGLRRILRCVHPSDQGALKRRIRDHLDGKTEIFACEYRIRARNGEWRWNLDRGRVVARDPVSGDPIRMMATSTDTSAFRAMKHRAIEAEERLKLAQAAAGAGLWDHDLGSGRVRLSANSRDMFGLTDPANDEIDFSVWRTLIHVDDLAETSAVLKAATASGEAFLHRHRVIRSDGEIRHMLMTGKTIVNETGTAANMLCVSIDETEQCRTAATLHRLEADLLQAARTSAIGAMAAALAGELNQPLTAVANYVKGVKAALSRGTFAIPGAAAALEGAETSAAAASLIVRRIRDKSALIRLHRQPEQLSQIVRDAARVALADLDQDAVRVRLAIPREANLVRVDRAQIQQVLVNLVGNAVDAMKSLDGRPELAIEASVNSRGEIEVRVIDHGPGFSDEAAGALSSPLFPAEKQGVGLGLAVCRTLIEAHGGRIWVEPVPKGGTVVGFTLDREGRHDAEEAAWAA